ncbi:putative fatty acid elongation protein 4 [Centruroides sculpturatus]|uniref:putative fatty acid elongation protein 4 n=1 Tax=Centruroides sculpturatus TaxID=218467 RepID=UPI000C6CA615|nr:putative fatty acid elongation protein 4 [Centruroides sculpturatus]
MSIIYLTTIMILQHHMKGRPPYNLKVAFTIWNGLLAIYSICSTLRGIPVLYEAFKRLTFYDIVCDISLTENTPAILFWITTFVFSKVWELGDTIFIILNKRNLMFLHCYHHVMAIMLTWYASFEESCFLLTSVYINTFVHSLMYSYFTLKCMKIKISSIVAMLITAVQVIQMVFAILLICWIYWLLANGHTLKVAIMETYGFIFTYDGDRNYSVFPRLYKSLDTCIVVLTMKYGKEMRKYGFIIVDEDGRINQVSNKLYYSFEECSEVMNEVYTEKN